MITTLPKSIIQDTNVPTKPSNSSSTTQTLGPTHTVDFSSTSSTDVQPTREQLETEWLLTNGLGGFAMGTVSAFNTRRYHSLLNVSLNPPVERINTLATIGETLHTPSGLFELDNHIFNPDNPAIHPHGWHYLTKFEKDSTVRWHYQFSNYKLIKELELIWYKQAAILRYTILPNGSAQNNDITLKLRPYIALRDFHQLQHQHDEFETASTHQHLQISRLGIPAFHMKINRGMYTPNPEWWTNFALNIETLRRQDNTQDLYMPGKFSHTFKPGEPNTLTLTFGTDEINPDNLPTSRAKHIKPILKRIKKQSTALTDLLSTKKQKNAKPLLPVVEKETALNAEQIAVALQSLTMASDDFVVERQINNEPMATILAGYPWFADWGRDTMISLPGCLLATNRLEEARKTLLVYAQHIKNGLIPNRFDDYGGPPHYNTVDASLWFIHAALEYIRIAKDTESWNDTLKDACLAIITAYQNGTNYHIKMDETDALISAGNPTTQLTWMDAARDGVVFTPRHGKPVEINALWYRALVGCAELLEATDESTAQEFKKLAKRVKKSFNDKFWNTKLNYCNDCITNQAPDTTLRPNQLIAVSLPHSPLSKEKQKKVINIIAEKLYTPHGIRTLSPTHPNYHGFYIGSMFQRDEAYHQGTAWGWLLGPFIEGLLRANKFTKKSRRTALKALSPILSELSQHSLGQLHEIFDADWPHEAKGCIAQAWSVAEVLRTTLLAINGE